jgi:serine/threonine protein kinase
MEYLPHGDLESFIEKGIPEGEIKLITIQLLEGLAIMHENSFTHRDLKPAVRDTLTLLIIINQLNILIVECLRQIALTSLVGKNW